MSEKPISPLRQRMLEDMNMRRFVPDTQREYVLSRSSRLSSAVPPIPRRRRAARFQLHLTETGAAIRPYQRDCARCGSSSR